ncbi:dTDP-4-dehydrorhamnose 3,5-epimerase family protein, partial [Falsiroseomonas sp.]|uniref:dTDP-4-dehydrorhamnose 3,5-epimerase family protein n=1 Tax=Falsiroseomonas sp. TaxID=2870721 RepID=UPI00272640EC
MSNVTVRSGSAEATSFDIAGPLLVSVRRFADARGAFVETYSRRDFAAIGIPDEFVQDNQSLSV